jgi:ribokinase
VAAARLGESVRFFGKVGGDCFGEELLDHLRRAGVDVSAVEIEPELATGVASILVDEAGENVIACTPGANAAVDESYVDRIFDRLASADVVLLQFEIPLSTIAHLLSRLPEDRPTVLIDPAPAKDLSDLPLDRIDVLTPNRGELLALASTSANDPSDAARELLERGVRCVLCTDGARGTVWVGERTVRIEAPTVEAIDTTAAGDAFNGALACVIGRLPMEDAIRWANAAGALATTKAGAQPSLPRREDVEALLRDANGGT